MDYEIQPLLWCRRPRIPKVQCCLWAAHLGAVDKEYQTLNAEETIYIQFCSTLKFGVWVFTWYMSTGFDLFVHLL